VRPIHLARLDKTRPVLVLTRELVRPYLTRVTVAPITSTVRGLSTEVVVGPRNGLDHESAVSLDNIVTIPAVALGRRIGLLLDDQELLLARAIQLAFDLDDVSQ
jgi:mRNA interferase MazF